VVTLDIELIQAFAKKNGIIAGACRAVPIESERLSASLFECLDSSGCSGSSSNFSEHSGFPSTSFVPFVPFVSSDLKKRTEPQESLRGVESIVVIGVAPTLRPADAEPPNPVIPNPSPSPVIPGLTRNPLPVAQLSSLGVNDDYHPRVKNLLRELVNELKKHSEFSYKILVDSPTLDERALAERAGIGFFGRNGLIISEKFGSRFNIGCLLTNLCLPKNFSEKKSVSECPSNCNLCIDACPTGALGGKNLNAARCISYLTQKEELSPEEEKMLSGQLYGCDICQESCPFNKKKEATQIDPREWIEMSDEDFQKKYGHTAMLWRGTKILKRNAEMISKSCVDNGKIIS
jgi:epoxyqueuosine reductase QueG